MEKESGVTFHLMEEKYDSGAILHQKSVEIGTKDTGKELREKIHSLARKGICELMQQLDREIIVPVAQDEKHASYFPQITEEEVMLDFSSPLKKLQHIFVLFIHGLSVISDITGIILFQILTSLRF